MMTKRNAGKRGPRPFCACVLPMRLPKKSITVNVRTEHGNARPPHAIAIGKNTYQETQQKQRLKKG